MKIEEHINGVWGNPDVKRAYLDLKKTVDEMIPEYTVGLHIQGAGAMCRAKAKEVVYKAKALEEMIKAVTKGR